MGTRKKLSRKPRSLARISHPAGKRGSQEIEERPEVTSAREELEDALGAFSATAVCAWHIEHGVPAELVEKLRRRLKESIAKRKAIH